MSSKTAMIALALMFATLLALAACAVPPPTLLAGPDPSDPAQRATTRTDPPVLSGTAQYAPVAPRPWRELNDAVAPRGAFAR